jgi:hypothetical protein
LPQVLAITGNRFAFDNVGFTPASGTVYVASTNPMLRLNWAGNQVAGAAVFFVRGAPAEDFFGRGSGPASGFMVSRVPVLQQLPSSME